MEKKNCRNLRSAAVSDHQKRSKAGKKSIAAYLMDLKHGKCTPKIILKKLDDAHSKPASSLCSPDNIGRSCSSISVISTSPDSGYPSDPSTLDSDFEDKVHVDPKIKFMMALGLLEKSCLQNDGDKLDTTINLENLQLERNKAVNSNRTKRTLKFPKRSQESTSVAKKTTKRALLKNFLKAKTNAFISLSSDTGRKLVKKYDHNDKKEIKEQARLNEQYCRTDVKTGTTGKGKYYETDWWDVVEMKHILPDNKCHKYVFSARERIVRNSEIVIGINSKSFANLNKCKSLSIKVERISGAAIVKLTKKKKESVKHPTLKKTCKFFNKLTFFTPVVKIEDIYS